MMQEAITPQPTVPTALADLLRAASSAERIARGPQRREEFRNTRHLLAGARANGFLYSDLGDVLDVSSGSIRNRTAEDGPVPASEFADLATVSLDELTAWHDKGLLGDAILNADGHASYLASDLIRALLTEQADVGTT